MSEIRCWLDDPWIADDILSEDIGFTESNGLEVQVSNVIYKLEKDYAREIFEADQGEVDPTVEEVIDGGMDWDYGEKFVSLTGDVEGVPCAAYWRLKEVRVLA